MKFGPVPVADAKGAILAHSVTITGAKGRARSGDKIAKGTVLTDDHVRDLLSAGLSEVVVARLEPGDVHEDEAAAKLASVLCMAGAALSLTAPKTGRVNLTAKSAGLVHLNEEAIHGANTEHPGITIATVPPFHRLEMGGLVATVKIIPYAVPAKALARASAYATEAIGFLQPMLKTATLIETQIAQKDLGEKGREAIARRLSRLGVALSPRVCVNHDVSSISKALQTVPGELLLILTGSATSDIADTAPRAVQAAGGRLIHYGMPVDPGNLLFLGTLGEKYVIGLPGCARSPALNGADWVLERAICGAPPSAAEIMSMGVGGLLKEIPSRPLPRRKIETL